MVAPITCPDCGGERTIRKGVCFRCGYRLPKNERLPAESSRPEPPAAESFRCEPPAAESFQTVPLPVEPTVVEAGPTNRATGTAGGLTGKITSIGTPRFEVVGLKWGGALAWLATKLALFIGFLLLLPLVITFMVVMLVIPPLRGLAISPLFLLFGRGGSGGHPRSEDVEIPVTPFTVTTADGRSVEIVLRGELQGGSPHLGDAVAVRGRPSRNGTINAKSVTNVDTGARITTREHPAVVRSRIKAVASVIALVLLGGILFLLFQIVSQMI